MKTPSSIIRVISCLSLTIILLVSGVCFAIEAESISGGPTVEEGAKKVAAIPAETETCAQLLVSQRAGYDDLKSKYMTEEIEVPKYTQTDPDELRIREPEDIDYSWLAEHSKKWMTVFYWMTPSDRGVFYDSILSLRRHKMAASTGAHLSEALGVATMRDLKDMYRFLDEVPIGEGFKLTPEMLNEAHRIGNKTQKIIQQVVSGGSQNPLSGYLFQPGVYKKRRNQLSIDRGVTPEQYKSLTGKLDELISYGVFKHVNASNRKDYELEESNIKKPYYDGALHRGWLSYPSSRIVPQAVADITDWANAQMSRWRKSESAALDPIKIAVIVKQALVYIHPWVDGNGRLSRAVRDKVLEAFNLLPESRIDMYHDIDLTIEQDYNLTKLGLARRVKLMNTVAPTAPQSQGRRHGLPIYDRGYFRVDGNIVQVTSRTNPSKDKSDLLLIGNNRQKEFIFTDNGLFQDFTGTHYTLVPGSLKEGRPKMVPIADANLTLYAIGGSGKRVSGIFTRDINYYQWELLRENLKLVEALNKDPALAGKVELVKYSEIEEANNNGAPHIYNWELNMVLSSITIKEDPKIDPLAVLMPFKGGAHSSGDATMFETNFINGSSVYNWDHILGQAQRLDLYYRRLERSISKQHPTYASLIEYRIKASRKKIHQAVRKLMPNLFIQTKALFEMSFAEQSVFKDERAWSYLKQKRYYIGLYQLAKNTPFWYENFEEGSSKFSKDHVALLRVSSSNRMQKTGLISEAWIGRTLEQKLPLIARAAKETLGELNRSAGDVKKFNYDNLSGPIVKWIAKRVLSNSSYQSLLAKFVREILSNPYQNRGLEVEFEREFYLMVLHWSDQPPKQGVSLTTRPGLIFGDSGATFTSAINDSHLYVVMVPIDKVRVALASTFSNEYEVTVMDPVFNIANMRRGFIKFESKHKSPSLAPVDTISPEEAAEKEVEVGDMNYIILSDPKNIPEEVKDVLRRTYYFSNGEPENIDSRPWFIDYSQGSEGFNGEVPEGWGGSETEHWHEGVGDTNYIEGWSEGFNEGAVHGDAPLGVDPKLIQEALEVPTEVWPE